MTSVNLNLWSDINYAISCVRQIVYMNNNGVFNALIVWKTFIDICFSIKSSLWALTAAYTKFQRMIWSMIWSCGHRSVGHVPRCVLFNYLIETPGDFTWKKLKAWKHTTLWFLAASGQIEGERGRTAFPIRFSRGGNAVPLAQVALMGGR